MPILGALLVSLFGELAKFLYRGLSTRLFIRWTGYLSISMLFIGLWTAFNLLIVPLAGQLFNTQYGQFLGLAFPPVAGSCIAAIMGGVTLFVVYRIKVRLVTISTAV